MSISNWIKKVVEPRQEKCPECENESLRPWLVRLHDGDSISEHIVGIRCERCSFTKVTAPWIVFHFFNLGLLNDQKMLTQSVEKCVIDHRQDCIPHEVWEIVLPPIKANLVELRLRELPTSDKRLWEGMNVICYEAYGKCVWGLD